MKLALVWKCKGCGAEIFALIRDLWHRKTDCTLCGHKQSLIRVPPVGVYRAWLERLG